MSVNEFINAMDGYYYEQELEAARVRMLYGLTYNLNVRREDKKSLVRLWPLPRIDGDILDPVKAKTTRLGQIHILEGKGFSGDFEKLTDEEIKWMRNFVQNKIWGSDDFLPKGETVKGNREKLKEFCKEKGILWQTAK